MKLLIKRIIAAQEVLLGKTFVYHGELVFLHESKKEEWFEKLNSPFGLDLDVFNYLRQMGVIQVHHHVVETGRLYTALFDDFLSLGITHTLPNIERIYLPAPRWNIYGELPYGKMWADHKAVFNSWNEGGGPNVPPVASVEKY